ncbi:MAG: cytochrome b N-terminal domain-containing protein [Alphaproteobacteria bacterium]|nr:cytochrome b N-terminal domain-containing protein [Alphaproteobacteria bacterium]
MASGHSNYTPSNGLTRWLDERLPIIRFANDNLLSFPTPKNLNYWYTFGAILFYCLVIQIVTGIVLAMHFVPNSALAFSSVEYIMRDVNYGWMLRYMHMNGASFFFIAVYVHMSRGLYYGSYKAPREILWILGVIIYLLMMATGFLGYTLPWSQMSLWGANVITNLLGAVLGQDFTQWLWGGFSVDNPTLQRFFSLHYLLPFVILGVSVLHVWALHHVGNNNPTGIDPKGPQDTVPLMPYYTAKYYFVITLFTIAFAVFVFFAPNLLGHADHYVEGNPLKTPTHIAPEWFLGAFYAMLRAIDFNLILDSKILGVLVMLGAIGILFIVPWLDTSRVRSANYRPVYWWCFWIFCADFAMLSWVGLQPAGTVLVQMGVAADGSPTGLNVTHLAQIGTLYYFAFFLVIMPLLGLFETPRTLPESIAQSVLKRGGAGTPAGAAAAPETRI